MHDGYRAIRRARTSLLTNGRLAVMSIRRASTTLSNSPASMRSMAAATRSFQTWCGIEGVRVNSSGGSPTGVSPDPRPGDPSGPDAAGADPARPDPTGAAPAGADPANAHPAGPDPLGPEPLAPDPLGPDPLGPDPLGPEPLGRDVVAERSTGYGPGVPRSRSARSIVVNQARSPLRPTTRRGTTRVPGAVGSNGRAPMATAPHPGKPTSSSTEMAAKAWRTWATEAASANPPGRSRRRAVPWAASPPSSSRHMSPSSPATSSRSGNSGTAIVRATSAGADVWAVQRPTVVTVCRGWR